jgi:hypothetical protein
MFMKSYVKQWFSGKSHNLVKSVNPCWENIVLWKHQGLVLTCFKTHEIPSSVIATKHRRTKKWHTCILTFHLVTYIYVSYIHIYTYIYMYIWESRWNTDHFTFPMQISQAFLHGTHLSQFQILILLCLKRRQQLLMQLLFSRMYVSPHCLKILSIQIGKS